MAAEQRPPSERGLPGPGLLRQPLSPAMHGSVSRPIQPRPTTSHRQEQPVSTPPRPTPSPRTPRTPPHTSMPERPSTPRSPEAGPPPLTPRASPAQRAPSTRTTQTHASQRAASQELRRPPPAPVDPPVALPPRDHPAAQRTCTDAEAIPPQPERCSGQPAPGHMPEPPAAPPPPLATGAEDGYTLGGFKNINGAFNSILASSLSALQGLKDLKEQKKCLQSLHTRPPKLKVSRHAQDGLTSRIAEAHERYLKELHDILIKAREDEIETLQRLVSSGKKKRKREKKNKAREQRDGTPGKRTAAERGYWDSSHPFCCIGFFFEGDSAPDISSPAWFPRKERWTRWPSLFQPQQLPAAAPSLHDTGTGQLRSPATARTFTDQRQQGSSHTQPSTSPWTEPDPWQPQEQDPSTTTPLSLALTLANRQSPHEGNPQDYWSPLTSPSKAILDTAGQRPVSKFENRVETRAVHNLSSRALSAAEIRLLSLGLRYIPNLAPLRALQIVESSDALCRAV
ncbi:hypothetical protein SELMODRAFT_430401 [Selaginella moellendorffii]|uniref:Uncharacterized protein n=1 Tax=Selaginella moellendorffii TaxID=88036 RepID=D8T9A9_SELML|nr:hypothetical protein SELMODRAFT_430401 [Selaginella moellendorffii]